jgi:hypothetical protein
LSTLGLKTSERKKAGISVKGDSGGAEGSSRSGTGSQLTIPLWLKWLDLVVLVAGLPIFLAAGLPLAGYFVGGGAWVAQRIVQVAFSRRATASEDPRTIVGFTAASMILRGWLVALSIFLVGLGDNDAGLAAAIFVISLFTVYFAMQFALRPMEER